MFDGDRKAVQRFRLVSWAYRFEGLLFLFGLVFLIIVMILQLKPVDSSVMAVPLGLGLGVAVLFAPLAFLFARGHSRRKKHFLGLSILGFFVFPVGFLGLGMASNSMLDMSEPKSHYLEVIEGNKYCYKDRKSVAVRDWRDSQKRFYIMIHNTRLCEATKPGDIFVVVIKEGLWGWPWMKDFRPHR